MGLPRVITQRELRNESGKVMRAVGRGESFIVTSNGLPVAALSPLHDRYFTQATVVLEAFRAAPAIDHARFRADVDAIVDQQPAPRG